MTRRTNFAKILEDVDALFGAVAVNINAKQLDGIVSVAMICLNGVHMRRELVLAAWGGALAWCWLVGLLQRRTDLCRRPQSIALRCEWREV